MADEKTVTEEFEALKASTQEYIKKHTAYLEKLVTHNGRLAGISKELEAKKVEFGALMQKITAAKAEHAAVLAATDAANRGKAVAESAWATVKNAIAELKAKL